MRRTVSTITLAFAVLVALCATALFLGFGRGGQGSGRPEVAAEVFRGIRSFRPAGWQVEEVPLGSTELSVQKVRDILSFDEVLQLRYRNGDHEFLLYVAYWRAGKVDLRTVGGHTPDSCWVYSGWEIADRQSGRPDYILPRLLAPGEYRCYTHTGVRQYVAFWHLLGGRPVALWEKGMPTPGYLWQLLNGAQAGLGGDQYLIRISSPRPLRDIWDEAALQHLLLVLGPTGLVERPSG